MFPVDELILAEDYDTESAFRRSYGSLKPGYLRIYPKGANMSGFHEILLVAVILLAILFVPRMMPRKIENRPKQPPLVLSRNKRLAITASVLFPVAVAGFLQPWRKDLILFAYFGLGPVILGWLLYWIITGRKK